MHRVVDCKLKKQTNKLYWVFPKEPIRNNEFKKRLQHLNPMKTSLIFREDVGFSFESRLINFCGEVQVCMGIHIFVDVQFIIDVKFCFNVKF